MVMWIFISKKILHLFQCELLLKHFHFPKKGSSHSAPLFVTIFTIFYSMYIFEVFCSPCYIPPQKNDPLFYHNQHKVQLPTASGDFKRCTPIPETTYSCHPTLTDQRHDSQSTEHLSHDLETLDLFPIHPTGILKPRRDNEQNEFKNPSFCDDSSSLMLSISAYDRPFFDFFGGN